VFTHDDIEQFSIRPRKKFELGGAIEDQYEGRSPQDIWDSLDSYQRYHFIDDHALEIEMLKDENYDYNSNKFPKSITSDFVKKAYRSDWEDLDEVVQNRFANHVRQGEYARGGMMADGGEIVTFDGHKYKVKTINRYNQDGVNEPYETYIPLYYDKKEKQSLTIGKETDMPNVYNVAYEDGKNIIYSKKNIDFFIEKGIWKKMAKGGKVSYREAGRNYEYVNTFGIEQRDFEKIVDAYHKSPSSDQIDRIDSRMTFNEMRTKYGAEKVDEVGNYIHKTHQSHGKMAKGGMLKEDDYVWNELGKKLVVNKVTDDEYFLSAFGQIGDSPFSREKVEMYLKNGQWSRKPKMAKGGALSEQNKMNEKVLALIQKAKIDSKLEFGQLVVSALTDANAHSEVRKFISIIENKPEWAEKPKEVDMKLPREEFQKQRAKTVYGSKYYDANEKIDDLGVEIANMSGWDVEGILDSLIFASKMSGRNDVAQVLEKLNTDDDKQDATKNKWEYTDKDEIEYVVVKDKNGKELKFDGKYVISGVHDLLEKGGKLTEIGKYFSKNDVVSVFVNGKNILDKNTVSGVWIKKDAKPMAEDVADTKIGKTTIRKGANGWVAKTFVDNFKGFDWEITTIKNYKGDLTTTAQGGKSEDRGGYQSFSFAIFGDPSIRLKTSRPPRVTDKIVSEQHTEAMKDWKERQDEISEMVDQIQAKKKSNDGAKITLNKLADGGAIGFDALAKKVAKNYEGDKVKKEFQEEYGKTYDKKEAEEVGKKVAGKVYRQQQAKGKMAKGGKVDKKTGTNLNRSQSKMTLISRKASEIRKANEPWRDAFNRAKAMLYS
jgi:hypothetical protein